MKSVGIIIFIASLLISVNLSCSNQKTNTDTVEITGIIQQTGMTSYQYGTHTITSGNKIYALRSSKVDLNKYNGKTVSITGIKISGYPVDGGPDFLEVLKVK